MSLSHSRCVEERFVFEAREPGMPPGLAIIKCDDGHASVEFSSNNRRFRAALTREDCADLSRAFSDLRDEIANASDSGMRPA